MKVIYPKSPDTNKFTDPYFLFSFPNEEEGKPIKYATVTDPTFVKELLYNKLKEEVTEFFNADLNKLEELADIMTVVGALIEVVGGTQEEFNQLYAEKLEKNGGFKGHTIGLFED